MKEQTFTDAAEAARAIEHERPMSEDVSAPVAVSAFKSTTLLGQTVELGASPRYLLFRCARAEQSRPRLRSTPAGAAT